MAFFESYKTRSGSFITVEWTFREWVFAKILGYIACLYFIGLMALIIPTLWLLIYFISIEEQRPMINIVGILTCVYLLFDYHFGLICWSFIIPFLGEQVLNKIIYYSTGLLLVHATLLIFGRKIFFYIKNMAPEEACESALIFTFFVYTIMMCFGGYLMGEVFVSVFITPKPFPYLIQ